MYLIPKYRIPSVPHCSVLLVDVCNVERRRFKSLPFSEIRQFPDYSPRKPTIRDSELVNQISITIKQRRSESLHSVLRTHASKFRSDHLIWVLTNIKNDYGLVLDFFDWACRRIQPDLEARCVITQIAISQKDEEIARRLILDSQNDYPQLRDTLIYTYKDWGSDPTVFDILFDSLVSRDLFEEAKNLLDRISSYGVLLSVDSCNTFLHRTEPAKALQAFSDLSQKGIHWNTKSHNIIIHALCQMRRLQEAHALLLKMEQRGCIPNTVSYSTVISGYCAIDELRNALKLLHKMKNEALEPNEVTHTSIVHLLCRRGEVEKAERILREHPTHGHTVLYTALINGYCRTRRIDDAYRLFHEMTGAEIPANVVTHTALISGLCEVGRIEEAAKVFDGMPERRVSPDSIAYTALINGYCKAGKMNEAFSLHNDMIRSGKAAPNIVTYTALADGLCKSGDVDAANELLHEISAKGYSPNTHTYNSFVNGLCRAGHVTEGEKLMREMESAGILPDVVTYTTLMDARCKSGELAKVHGLLQEMLGKKIRPTVVTFNVLMNGFCTAGMLGEAERLLNWMVSGDVTPNAAIYNSMMKQYCIRRDMRAAKALFGRMPEPDENSYNIMLKGHSRARNATEALYLHEEMVRKGFRLTAAAYDAFIRVLLKRNKLSDAEAMFKEMKENGVIVGAGLQRCFDDVSSGMTVQLCDDAIDKLLEPLNR